jgi:hypothetical protein
MPYNVLGQKSLVNILSNQEKDNQVSQENDSSFKDERISLKGRNLTIIVIPLFCIRGSALA